MISYGDLQRGYTYKLVKVHASNKEKENRYILQKNPLLVLGIIVITVANLDLLNEELEEVRDTFSFTFSTKVLYKSVKGVHFKRKGDGTKENIYLTPEDLSILSVKYPELDLYTFGGI